MCIAFLSYKSSPHSPFILLANRDEFYSRPTRPLHVWEDIKGVYAGRDEEAGGTWLAFKDNGRFALLTNFRGAEGKQPNERSRGLIINDFLESCDDPMVFLEGLKNSSKNYDGFNLIFGTLDQVYYFSNVTNECFALEPGFYGLSNHLLNTPWPKVKKGLKDFEEILKSKNSLQSKMLLKILQDSTIAEDHELPETGVSLELERFLSSVFIHNQEKNYGTRCSSLIIADSGLDEVSFFERTYLNGVEEFEDREIRFKMDFNL